MGVCHGSQLKLSFLLPSAEVAGEAYAVQMPRSIFVVDMQSLFVSPNTE